MEDRSFSLQSMALHRFKELINAGTDGLQQIGDAMQKAGPNFQNIPNSGNGSVTAKERAQRRAKSKQSRKARRVNRPR